MLESGEMWTMAWEDRDIGGQTETLKEREALEDEQKNLRTHWGIEGWTEALEDGQMCWRVERRVEEWKRHWREDSGLGGETEVLEDRQRYWRRKRGI